MPDHKGHFLWPYDDGSVEEAGYEFLNAQTEEYRKEWWEILRDRASGVGIESLQKEIKELKANLELEVEGTYPVECPDDNEEDN